MPPLDEAILSRLLTRNPALEAQAALADAGLADEAGLVQLLAAVEAQTRRDPALAQRLAAWTATAVRRIAPDLTARATYLQGVAAVLQGELAVGRSLIEAARDAFVTQKEDAGAWQASIGLMSVLGELGEYEAALAAGDGVLAALDLREDVPDPVRRRFTAQVAQNRGICWRRMGAFAAAADAFDTAAEHFAALGGDLQAAHIRNNQGMVLLDIGRGPEALAAFQGAHAVFAAADQTTLKAESLTNIGQTQLLLGQYQASLATFDQARDQFEALAVLQDQHVLLLETAHAYLALNLFADARDAFQSALDFWQTSGAAHYRARAHWGMGSALVALGLGDQAESALAAAATLFETAGNSRQLVTVWLEQAALLAQRGSGAPARSLAEAALALADEGAWPLLQAYARLRLVDLRWSDSTAVTDLLATAEELVTALNLPPLRYALYQRQGRHLVRLEQTEAAEVALRLAVAEIERQRGALAREALRVSFLRDKMVAYEALLALYLHADTPTAWAQAFEIAEQAKSRTLLDLMSGLITEGLTDLPDAAAATRLQALEAQLSTLYNQALDDDGHHGRQGLLATFQDDTVRLEQTIRRIRGPYRTPIAGAASPAATTAQRILPALRLPPDTALLAYHIVGDEVLAFVHDATGLRVHQSLAPHAALVNWHRQLARQWQRFNLGPAFAARHERQLLAATQRILSQLYQALLAPLLADVTATRLLIVPHGVLHHLPFHAAWDGAHYLVERYEVAYAPSMAVYTQARRTPRRAAGGALLMGVPDPQLSHVEAEIAAVAAQVPQAACYLGPAAQRAVWDREASRHAILHLACHGLFRRDNPMFSALRLGDGWLKACDIATQALPGALVVLSACESGRSGLDAGDEILGLTRAFLAAGAATLVVSLWLAQDEPTAQLMTHFYTALGAGHGPAAALREAQRALLARHPHPYHWAPFVVIGQDHLPLPLAGEAPT